MRARTSASDSPDGAAAGSSPNSSDGASVIGRDGFGTGRGLGVLGVRRTESGGRGVAGNLINGASPAASNAEVKSGSFESVRSGRAVDGAGTGRARAAMSMEGLEAPNAPSNSSSDRTDTGRLSSEVRSVRSRSMLSGSEGLGINEKS